MKTIILTALLLCPFPVQSESQYVITSKASAEDYIMARAIAYNFRPDIAAAIAKAESGFDVGAKNTSSSASGLFQFINGTFEGFCIKTYGFATSLEEKNDPIIQTECAVKMLSEGGLSHWDESRHVWGKIL